METEITFAMTRIKGVSLGGLLLAEALSCRNTTQVRTPITFQCVLIISTIIIKINVLEDIQRHVI